MWRLESYSEKSVVLWFTPSKCTDGKITLPSTTSTVEYNRFYATMMAAKIAKAPVYIYYDDAVDGCPVISYGLREGRGNCKTLRQTEPAIMQAHFVSAFS